MQRKIDILGVVLASERYQLGKKATAKLLCSQIPRNLSQLQSLLGKLNHCAPFVLDYKRKVKPLVGLLSGEDAGKWREDHTRALNDLAVSI